MPQRQEELTRSGLTPPRGSSTATKFTWLHSESRSSQISMPLALSIARLVARSQLIDPSNQLRSSHKKSSLFTLTTTRRFLSWKPTDLGSLFSISSKKWERETSISAALLTNIATSSRSKRDSRRRAKLAMISFCTPTNRFLKKTASCSSPGKRSRNSKASYERDSGGQKPHLAPKTMKFSPRCSPSKDAAPSTEKNSNSPIAIRDTPIERFGSNSMRWPNKETKN